MAINRYVLCGVGLLRISSVSCTQGERKSSTSLDPVDYVSTLVGSQSKHSLSTGNTYPAIAMPWGMNFWTPQTGRMGDGWAYTYDADKINKSRGIDYFSAPYSFTRELGEK